MPTLLDISRKTGLSVATVSNTLNGRPGYSKSTRRLVLQTAEELGYTANPLARGLAGKSTMTIGLLWDLAGPHLSEGMARSITLRTQKRGYTTYLFDCMSDPEVTRRQLMECRMRGVDAVVLRHGPALAMDEVCRQLEKFKAAVVVSAECLSLPVDLIQHDMVAGYMQTADYLADTGRKKGAILTPGASSHKIRGFLTRCRERGMEISDQSVIELAYDGDKRQLATSATTALDACFPVAFPFDSLICTADEFAAAAILWLRRNGYRVPEDVAVIGCNDAPFCGVMTTPLASIGRNDEQLADEIEEMVFSRLDDSDLPARRRIVQSQFIWRESAGRRCEHQEN